MEGSGWFRRGPPGEDAGESGRDPANQQRCVRRAAGLVSGWIEGGVCQQPRWASGDLGDERGRSNARNLTAGLGGPTVRRGLRMGRGWRFKEEGRAAGDFRDERRRKRDARLGRIRREGGLGAGFDERSHSSATTADGAGLLGWIGRLALPDRDALWRVFGGS